VGTAALAARAAAKTAALRADRRGNVAITFALCLIPIAGMVGAAIDYSRANSVKAAMQSALDAAALMLSKDAANLKQSELKRKANDYFKAEFHRPEAVDLNVKPRYNSNGVLLDLTLTGSARIDTAIIKLVGHKHLDVGALSQVVWGAAKKIEIALVLDNTGSMSTSGKIQALVEASYQFIELMKKTSRTPGDVKVAIVPFDTHVNIGTAYKGSSWIDWSYMIAGGSSGVENDSDDDQRHDVRDAQDSWNGCVIDRSQPNDVLDTTPSGGLASAYPAENCTLSTITPLTSDFATLHAAVDKMKASGKTNLTIGLVWGWHALTPNQPLPEGTTPDKETLKYILFMTDGLNTQNRFTTKPADIDKRTKALCDNIKAAKIRVFTVRVLEGNEALLKSWRHQPGDVLQRDGGEPARPGVRIDRQDAVAAADCALTACQKTAMAGAFHWQSANAAPI
jgi:Flp pilus assembly protein TadG